MVDTLILGGGISGLLAAHVFGSKETTLVERSGKIGGNYLSGGLKYLRRTSNMEGLLAYLRVPWMSYFPAGGLLWDDVIHRHPEWIKLQHREKRLEIQQIHWKRTRGSLDGFTPTCMNDPMGEGNAEAMRMDHGRLLGALESNAMKKGVRLLVSTEVKSVHTDYVDTSVGTIQYKRLITTVPLTGARNLFHDVIIPEVRFRMLTVCRTKRLPAFLMERNALEFDYIYTPKLSIFHRASRTPDNQWEMEAAGTLQEPEASSPFQGEVHFDNVNFIPGHLVPLNQLVQWPRNTLPLGRFAEWDTRSTAEKSLDRLIAWKETQRE